MLARDNISHFATASFRMAHFAKGVLYRQLHIQLRRHVTFTRQQIEGVKIPDCHSQIFLVMAGPHP